MLRALVPADCYIPDFVMPPPDSPLPDLDVELDRMEATLARQVRAELAPACGRNWHMTCRPSRWSATAAESARRGRRGPGLPFVTIRAILR